MKQEKSGNLEFVSCILWLLKKVSKRRRRRRRKNRLQRKLAAWTIGKDNSACAKKVEKIAE
jgi:hypothetical protein